MQIKGDVNLSDSEGPITRQKAKFLAKVEILRRSSE